MQNIVSQSPFANNCQMFTQNGETNIIFQKPQEIHNFLSFLKTCQAPFQILVDVCGVHYPNKTKCFEVVYHLLSITTNTRLRVIIQLEENEEVHTVDSVYKSANWFERETFDMYGIKFTNSTDLRRILTDYNFQGHPLRKDFPLTGHTELRYDSIKGEVVYEPVSLTQDYRNFDFQSNWKGEVFQNTQECHEIKQTKQKKKKTFNEQ
jgi:NADH-quinone oxidoreductase subunit C